MKYCENCGKKLKEEADICLNCGKMLPPKQTSTPIIKPEKGLEWWHILLIVLGSVFLSIAIFIMAFLSEVDTIIDELEIEEEITEQMEEKRKPKVYSIGENIIYNKVNYQIVKMERSKGNEYDQPREGREYIVVTIRMQNYSKATVSYNAFDWTITNSKNQENQPSFTLIDEETSLSSGILSPGETKEGTIVFDQRSGESRLTLNYYSNIFRDDDPKFQVRLK